MNHNVLMWLGGPDTGQSSKAIVSWMERDVTLAATMGNRLEYPRDPADLGRCIRLMDIEPSYRARIREMADASPQWAALVFHWNELEALYREELPSGKAPKCYDLMQSLLWPNGFGKPR